MPDTDAELLRRFEPVLRFTRGEWFLPIAAERFVRGQISGIIRGAMVTLQSTSHVAGDIHHMA